MTKTTYSTPIYVLIHRPETSCHHVVLQLNVSPQDEQLADLANPSFSDPTALLVPVTVISMSTSTDSEQCGQITRCDIRLDTEES